MKRDRTRVWITGIGVIAGCGTGREAFWAGVRDGRSPVKRVDRFDPSPFRSQVAAQVDDFNPGDHMDGKTARLLDRFSQFGLAAGRLALSDARWSPSEDGKGADPARTGVYLGSALGGIAFAEAQHERYIARGIRAVSPMLALAVFGGAAPANLGIALKVRGPILSTANSCASGSVALGEALAAIRAGEIDAAIAGGVECPLSPLAFGAFDIIRALSGGSNDAPERACRPFDARRDGFVMGEGAALLVLERADLAAARGASPYAEVLGYGATSDAHHMVQPRPDGRDASRSVSPWRTQASRPARSTTSTRTPARHRSATSRNRAHWRSRWVRAWAKSRSAGRRPSTGTRSALRVQSRPPSVRSRFAMAGHHRRSTFVTWTSGSSRSCPSWSVRRRDCRGATAASCRRRSVSVA